MLCVQRYFVYCLSVLVGASGSMLCYVYYAVCVITTWDVSGARKIYVLCYVVSCCSIMYFALDVVSMEIVYSHICTST